SATSLGELCIMRRVNISRRGPYRANNSANASSSPIWLRTTSVSSYSCSEQTDMRATIGKLLGGTEKFIPVTNYLPFVGSIIEGVDDKCSDSLGTARCKAFACRGVQIRRADSFSLDLPLNPWKRHL